MGACWVICRVFSKKTKGKINFKALTEHHIELVRRLTGGRAVLHDQELTYSVIVAESHPKMPASVKEAYKVISKGLLEGFRNLDIEASFAIPEGKLQTTQSAVCFEEPSWYELIVDGKKKQQAVLKLDKRVLFYSMAPSPSMSITPSSMIYLNIQVKR